MNFRILSLLFLWSVMLWTNPASALSCTAPEVVMYKIGSWGAPIQARACDSGTRLVTPYQANICFQGYATPMTSYSDEHKLTTPFEVTSTGTQTYSAKMPYTTKRTYADGRKLDLTGGTWTVTLNPVCGVPPPENNCAEKEGRGAVYYRAPGQAKLVGNYCAANGCQATFAADDFEINLAGAGWGNQGSVSQTGRNTGQRCTDEPVTPEPPECVYNNGVEVCQDAEKPDCATMNGDEVCANENPNCGTVNGEEFCAGPGQPDGSCVQTPGGQMVCIQPSKGPTDKPKSPPAPNNGVTGQTADATATMTKPSTGTTQHVYSSGTVSNSTHKQGDGNCDAGEEGTADCETYDGDGNCDAGEEGTPDCEDDGGGCEDDPQTPANECGSGDGDGAVKGKGGTAKTYKESAQGFLAVVRASPLGAGVMSIGQSMPAGQCPPLEMDFFGNYVSTDVHCTVAGELMILSALFLGIWAIAAVRILMSA